MDNWPLLITSSVLGLGLLFAGYPLFRILLVLTGALLGFLYGPELLLVLGVQPTETVAWAAALVTALLLALLAWQLFSFALFAWGFMAGYFIGLSLIDNVFIALGAGVVVALLALAFGRIGLMALTSLVGAWLLTNVVLLLIGSGYPLPTGNIMLAPAAYAAIIIVTFLGVLLQLRLWPEARGW